jgi:hypothetical protein
MLKRLRIVPVTLLALATGACDSFLDVNKNPNAAVDARVDLTFPTVVGVFGHSVIGGSLAFWGAEWTQQFSFNGTSRSYSNIHRYELSEIDANSPWDASFAIVMNEAKNIMDRTSGSNDWAYHGISKFIFAWNYGIVADAWGPVPFTEAFNPAIRNPKYDEPKVVYENVQRLITESIADMQKEAVRKPGQNDLLYRGDMSKWIKLAHTVQATYHLRLASAPGENKQDRAQKALTSLQSGFQSNADDAVQTYPGGNNRRPPWYIFRNLAGTFVASDYLVDRLAERNDPRTPIMLRPAVADTPTIVFRGHVSGTPGVSTNTVSNINNFFAGDSTSLTWLSYSHAKFVEAEARLILSGAAAADAPYRAAIRANMEKLGVAPAAIDAYIAARPALATVANPLEEIIREKYIANYLNPEVWTDWRRTGYPVIPPVTSEYLPHIPYRIRSPQSELQNNSDNIAATGIPSGLVGMSTKLWWASGS